MKCNKENKKLIENGNLYKKTKIIRKTSLDGQLKLHFNNFTHFNSFYAKQMTIKKKEKNTDFVQCLRCIELTNIQLWKSFGNGNARMKEREREKTQF